MDKKKTAKVLVELDHTARLIVEQKQLEVHKALGKRPTKSEAINILIKQ
jgi:hypothetical protein